MDAEQQNNYVLVYISHRVNTSVTTPSDQRCRMIRDPTSSAEVHIAATRSYISGKTLVRQLYIQYVCIHIYTLKDLQILQLLQQ